MAEARTCPRCGTALDAESASGLCPHCLIGLNLSSPTEAPTGFETEDRAGEPPAPRETAVPSSVEIAAFFPELEVVGLIGRGGMGAVYMARQRRLDRLVALKVLPPTVGRDPSFAERFTREAQALARLNHPHIVTLYEFGQKEGLFYFLMEYVDGVNLRQLLKASRLGAAEALAIVPQICEALQYAHEKGIVHRDIKPENLLLNKQGEVKIADFGIAKLVAEKPEPPDESGAEARPEAGLTRTKGTLGTPQYMAPEQMARPLEVDHRADIYSLGVVFYQMLTGELPAGKFEPPSNKVVIDVRLDQVVLRALEKLPERRYQHVSEVTKDLKTIQETAHQKSAATTPPSTASAPVKRPKAVLRWAMLAIIVLLGIPGLLSFLRRAEFHPHQGIRSATSAGWDQLAPADLLKGRHSTATVWTGEEMIVFGGEGRNVTYGDGARYDLKRNVWTPLVLQGAAPSARTCATAIWTGSAMVIWGGYAGSYAEDVNRNDGARFYPSNNVWKPLSIIGAPCARFDHAALWTGQEMLIWGGFGDLHMQLVNRQSDSYLNTGGRYDLNYDTWRDITTNGAPSGRLHPAMVWTGREMLVWGGGNVTGELGDGARYDPVTDKWKPMSRQGAPGPRIMPGAVWTGREMVVWGGCSYKINSETVYFQDGARYNPESDTWTPLNTNGAPRGRSYVQTIWTGHEAFFWGGVNDSETSGVKDPKRYLGAGGLYHPATDTWTEIPTQGAATPRALIRPVWTGEGVILFGGYNGTHLNDTFYYSPGQ